MLKVTSLKKSYIEPGGRPLAVLDVPAFDVAAGEQMVLVGPSGGGKTTLLHIISGITRPDDGAVEIDGTNLVPLSEAARDRFAHKRSVMSFRPSICCPDFRPSKTCFWG